MTDTCAQFHPTAAFFEKEDMSGPYEEIAFVPGETIFQQGEEAVFAYFIRKGRVAILKNGHSVATMTELMVFGESVLFGNMRRLATACALVPTECAFISASQLMVRLAAFGPATTDAMGQILTYIRSTLPARLRGGDIVERPIDRRMRTLLDEDALKAVLTSADPFLRALLDILRGYVRARLPPLGPDA
ncbi:cyclic nucleotide-binding domain-containing protein [Telmatospirillum siberiense]|uniref:Cyclic nucleotide-binding domain-containing protein n=1 Tax=Telmatospirillum siberiense TaxID=382514 RepID=A0A2N3PM15_9PROT|nr:cyclic nucleotide-binding domain-containing protein [Telmatospirillum siberiense]PKU21444.1 hypothetical protein CWS72_26705 [Telmatospirillum siberiense]